MAEASVWPTYLTAPLSVHRNTSSADSRRLCLSQQIGGGWKLALPQRSKESELDKIN